MRCYPNRLARATVISTYAKYGIECVQVVSQQVLGMATEHEISNWKHEKKSQDELAHGQLFTISSQQTKKQADFCPGQDTVEKNEADIMREETRN